MFKCRLWKLMINIGTYCLYDNLFLSLDRIYYVACSWGHFSRSTPLLANRTSLPILDRPTDRKTDDAISTIWIPMSYGFLRHSRAESRGKRGCGGFIRLRNAAGRGIPLKAFFCFLLFSLLRSGILVLRRRREPHVMLPMLISLLGRS